MRVFSGIQWYSVCIQEKKVWYQWVFRTKKFCFDKILGSDIKFSSVQLSASTFIIIILEICHRYCPGT